MKGPGGTDGGFGKYFVGMCLMIGAVYLFLDSVRMTTGGMGWCSYHAFGGHTAIVFVPFFLGVVALCYNYSWQWAKWLTIAGLGIIVVEILSRIHFWLMMKTTHFLILLIMFAVGTALIFRSFRNHS